MEAPPISIESEHVALDRRNDVSFVNAHPPVALRNHIYIHQSCPKIVHDRALRALPPLTGEAQGYAVVACDPSVCRRHHTNAPQRSGEGINTIYLRRLSAHPEHATMLSGQPDTSVNSCVQILEASSEGQDVPSFRRQDALPRRRSCPGGADVDSSTETLLVKPRACCQAGSNHNRHSNDRAQHQLLRPPIAHGYLLLVSSMPYNAGTTECP